MNRGDHLLFWLTAAIVLVALAAAFADLLGFRP